MPATTIVAEGGSTVQHTLIVVDDGLTRLQPELNGVTRIVDSAGEVDERSVVVTHQRGIDVEWGHRPFMEANAGNLTVPVQRDHGRMRQQVHILALVDRFVAVSDERDRDLAQQIEGSGIVILHRLGHCEPVDENGVAAGRAHLDAMKNRCSARRVAVGVVGVWIQRQTGLGELPHLGLDHDVEQPTEICFPHPADQCSKGFRPLVARRNVVHDGDTPFSNRIEQVTVRGRPRFGQCHVRQWGSGTKVRHVVRSAQAIRRLR